MKKKSIRIIGILLLSSLMWYLFIKQDDYIITFKVKTPQGVAFYFAEKWNTIKDKKETITIQNLAKNQFKSLKQEVTIKDSTSFIFNWQLSPSGKNTTNVKVGITEKNGSFLNRLLIPFQEIPAASIGKNKLSNFNELINNHLKRFKVTIEEEEVIPNDGYYAYTLMESSLKDKAKEITLRNVDITNFLLEKSIPITGDPLLEITEWDLENNLVKFNFCFPVGDKANFPEDSKIKFKKFPPKKALKATFNGNYRFSQRAWFALKAYAQHNNIAIVEKPIEIFYNNPNLGGNEIEWKAEIFMPLLNP